MPVKFPQYRPDRAIGAFDARAAVELDGDGWISTPNMPFVPEPYAIAREVRLRADGRYGFDDYTRWPQRYHTQTPHLICIPRSPMTFSFHVSVESASCVNLIFSDPSLTWFTPIENSSVPDIFRLRTVHYKEFQKCLDILKVPVQEVIDSHSAVEGLSRGAGWFHLTLDRILSRLADIPMTYRDLIRHVTEFQRYWLELCGLLEYMLRYLPRIRDARNVDHPVCEDLMGVIVTEANQVQALFSAGIPVWYLRPSYELTAQINVKLVVNLLRPSVCLDDWSDRYEKEPPYSVIFRGSASDIKFVHSRYQFTRSSCSSRPLFDLKTSSSQTCSGQTKTVPARKRKGDHYEPCELLEKFPCA